MVTRPNNLSDALEELADLLDATENSFRIIGNLADEGKVLSEEDRERLRAWGMSQNVQHDLREIAKRARESDVAVELWPAEQSVPTAAPEN